MDEDERKALAESLAFHIQAREHVKNLQEVCNGPSLVLEWEHHNEHVFQIAKELGLAAERGNVRKSILPMIRPGKPVSELVKSILSMAAGKGKRRRKDVVDALRFD